MQIKSDYQTVFDKNHSDSQTPSRKSKPATDRENIHQMKNDPIYNFENTLIKKATILSSRPTSASNKNKGYNKRQELIGDILNMNEDHIE